MTAKRNEFIVYKENGNMIFKKQKMVYIILI